MKVMFRFEEVLKVVVKGIEDLGEMLQSPKARLPKKKKKKDFRTIFFIH